MSVPPIPPQPPDPIPPTGGPPPPPPPPGPTGAPDSLNNDFDFGDAFKLKDPYETMSIDTWISTVREFVADLRKTYREQDAADAQKSNDVSREYAITIGDLFESLTSMLSTGSWSDNLPDWFPDFIKNSIDSFQNAVDTVLGWIGLQIPFLNTIDRQREVDKAFEENEKYHYQDLGMDIAAPPTYVEETPEAIQEGTESTGTGVGAESLSIGLHSNNLEIILSASMLRALAQNLRFPISGRLLAQLQFLPLELLTASSLLASVPAVRFLANALGTKGLTDQATANVVALALVNRIIELVNSNTVRSLVNGIFNDLSPSARAAYRGSFEDVKKKEGQLNDAIASGDPASIKSALRNLIQARLRLANIRGLQDTFGSASIGELSALTRGVGGTINLSLLIVALAYLGQALGVPGLAPQLFANLTGLPEEDIRIALTSGANIADVLDNPTSVLFLKQSLVNTLTTKYGFTDKKAQKVINQAINKGGFESFSDLQAALVEEFRKQGFSSSQSNLLANQAVTAISGDLGIPFLNAVFSTDFDSAAVSSEIVSSLYGVDAQRAAAMLNGADQETFKNTLQGAIDQTLAAGSYRTQREFRDALAKNLGAAGFNSNDALFLANNVAGFLATGSIGSPYGISPSRLAAIHNALGSSLDGELVDEAISRTLARGPFSSEDAFRLVLREELLGAGLSPEQARRSLDLAFAGLPPPNVNPLFTAGPSPTLSLTELTEQLGSHITEVLTPVLGKENAEEIKDQILGIVLSLRDLIDEEIKWLRDTKGEEEQEIITQRLVELLKTLLRPNAEIGYLIHSIGDPPRTLISATLLDEPKKSISIPV